MDWQQASTSSGSTGGPCTGGTLHSYELVSTQAVRQNVFLGRQREPEGERVHLVAIKRVQFDRLNAIQLEQQVKEVRLTALLRHPNVMPILSSFVRLNELWIVFPVANYLSCKELAVPFGLNEPAIAFIARDVLRALTYLHERGIVHLGIRGSRILVDSSGQCRLAGLKYSLSMIRNARLQSTLYQYPNNATVNLKWLSPEVLEQNLYGYNEKSDIYSLGITCCELANGCTPFKGMPASQILIDKLTGNAPRPLDSTCVQLDEVISVLPERQKQRAEFYKARKFSYWLHHFTNELCLNLDVNVRPSARDLLKHKFLIQVATCKSLLALLRDKRPIDEQIDSWSPDDTPLDSDESTNCDPEHNYCGCLLPINPLPITASHQDWSF